MTEKFFFVLWFHTTFKKTKGFLPLVIGYIRDFENTTRLLILDVGKKDGKCKHVGS